MKLNKKLVNLSLGINKCLEKDRRYMILTLIMITCLKSLIRKTNLMKTLVKTKLTVLLAWVRK